MSLYVMALVRRAGWVGVLGSLVWFLVWPAGGLRAILAVALVALLAWRAEGLADAYGGAQIEVTQLRAQLVAAGLVVGHLGAAVGKLEGKPPASSAPVARA